MTKKLKKAQRGLANASDSLAIYNNALQQKAYYDKLKPYYESVEINGWNPWDKISNFENAHLNYSIPNYWSPTEAKKFKAIQQQIKNEKDPNIHYLVDMITGALDPNAPALKYDDRIKPQGIIEYNPKNFWPGTEPIYWKSMPSYQRMPTSEKKLLEAISKDNNIKNIINTYPLFRNDPNNKKEGNRDYYIKWAKAKGFSEKDMNSLLYKVMKEDELDNKLKGFATVLPYYDPIAVKPANMLTDDEFKKRYNKYGPSGLPKSRIDKLGLKAKPVTPAKTKTSKKEETPKSDQLTLKPLPLKSIETPREELNIIPQGRGYNKGETNKVVPPQSATQWVQNPATGTWHQIERPVNPMFSPKYNLNTGSYQGGGEKNDYIELELDDTEIGDLIAQGYVVEELPKAQNGGEQNYYTHPGSKGVYRKVGNNWEVDWNKSGNFQPLSKGDVKERQAVLNKSAKPLMDADYYDMMRWKAKAPEKAPQVKAVPKTSASTKAQKTFDKSFKVTDKTNYEKAQAEIERLNEVGKKKAAELGLPYTEKNERDTANRVWSQHGVYNPITGAPISPDEIDAINPRKHISFAPPENPTIGDYAGRAWEYMTNPFTAFEYSASTGDASNMPWNINEMRMRGIDPGVVQGRNLVGNALNSSINLFDAGDKVVRNVNAGNYWDAAGEALRFLPGAALETGLGKTLGRTIGRPIINELGATYNDIRKALNYNDKATELNRVVTNGTEAAAQASKKLPLRYKNPQIFDDIMQQMRYNDMIGGHNPIKYGDDINPDAWYHIDPLDYRTAEEAQTLGRQDAFSDLNSRTSNILPSKDPEFMSDLNAAKFKMQSGLDSPVGPQIGPLSNRWREIDKVDLDLPSIEQMGEYGLNPEHFAFKPFVSNESTLSRAERNMINNIEGAKQTALAKGDTWLAKQFDTYIAKIKTDALKKFTGTDYTGEEAMRNIRFNMAEGAPLTPDEEYAKLKDIDISNTKQDAYETISSSIEDMRANKVDKWQTAEGKKRLQNMIDSTPGLKELGLTPESYVESLVNLENTNKTYLEKLMELDKVNEKIMNLSKQADLGNISESEYYSQVMDLEAEVLNKRNEIANIRGDINKHGEHNAFVQGDRLGIGEANNPLDLKQTIEHEIAHVLQKGFVTSLDKELSRLKLLEDDLFSDVPSYSSFREGWDTYVYSPEYVGESKEYWRRGSNGREKLPMVAEIRQDLLERGIIKDVYDKITPEMLEKHYDKYMSKGSGRKSIPLRVYDIMEDEEANFKLLAGVLNKLAVAAPVAVGVGTALGSQEDTSPQYKKGGNVDKLRKFIV